MPETFKEATTRRWVHESLSATEAARTAGDRLSRPVFILVHTPIEARFLRLDETAKAVNEADTAVDLELAFEIRFFSAEGEIFWRRTGAASGRAVLTCDAGREAPGDSWRELETPTLSRPGERLLWGRVDGPFQNGWSQLSSPRIGPISIPARSEGGARAVLKVVEYARQSIDGNVVPAGERLADFGWVAG